MWFYGRLQIKDFDAGSKKEISDRVRIANVRGSSLDDDSIETRKLSADFTEVSFYKNCYDEHLLR